MAAVLKNAKNIYLKFFTFQIICPNLSFKKVYKKTPNKVTNYFFEYAQNDMLIIKMLVFSNKMFQNKNI